MSLGRQELASLLDVFEDLDLSELVLSVGGTRVELTNSGKPPRGELPAETTISLHRVLAPSVGIVRVAPGLPGTQVRADDVVCVLDVWTSSIPVQAGVDGTVREVHVEEGTMVEYGQSLFGIEHTGAHRVAGTSPERPAASRSSSSSA
jgi:multidrug efflux pump subunit AcrA (membrane-fusion protein)